MVFEAFERKKDFSQFIVVLILAIFLLSACSSGNGIEEPMAIDDKLIRVESVVPWTASESNETSEDGTQVIPVLVVHTEILAHEMDSLQDVQDWKVEIRNSEGTIVPPMTRPELVNSDPVDVEDLIQMSVDWYFEVDPDSGPFTLMLPGNKQIPLQSFIGQIMD